MKKLFDDVSYQCSKEVTQSYSTSFSLATKMLNPSIRQDIYNIYGFVRFADEIVDSFHDYPKEELFNLRFQLATGQLENHARVGQVKREVARVLTELREREISAAEDFSSDNDEELAND